MLTKQCNTNVCLTYIFPCASIINTDSNCSFVFFESCLSVLQLNMAKDSETVLQGFHEGPLKFPPTYKFDVGTDTYDTR